MAMNDDFSGIYLLVGLQIIHYSAQTPGPRPDCSPLFGGDSQFNLQCGPYALLPSFGIIQLQITIISGSDTVTFSNQCLDFPPFGLLSTGKLIMRFIGVFQKFGMRFGQYNGAIGMNTLVSFEVQSCEHRNRVSGFSRQI